MDICFLRHNLQEAIRDSIEKLGFARDVDFSLERPTSREHGDFATNVALVLANEAGKKPSELAQDILDELVLHPVWGMYVQSVDTLDLIAGPGFINFYVKPDVYGTLVDLILEKGNEYGKTDVLSGKRYMVEYTDPNPFKVFHIGHLMPNVIGESIARLLEWNGAHVIRANYQGDVGPHVAKALFGMRHFVDAMPSDDATLSEKTAFLGKAYAYGSSVYVDGSDEKVEIDALNKAVYEKSDPDLMALYEKGRTWSLDHFEELYQKLGTRFDRYYFESDVWQDGVRVVREQLEQGVFSESNGAIVFEGEPFGLHTRVFINSAGLPTYEAKEIGLNTKKFHDEPTLDHSIIITGNEQEQYFKVVLQALSLIDPSVGSSTEHLWHGIMLGPGGSKMSSRSGQIITGEGLIEEMEEEAEKRVSESGVPSRSNDGLSTAIAIAGIKYMILKQQRQKNIIFDRDQALSFEGDSGPYLQYTYVRTRSLLRKAKESGTSFFYERPDGYPVLDIERQLIHSPWMISDALEGYATHTITQYLVELARTYNSWYGQEKFLDPGDRVLSSYRVGVAEAVSVVLKNGLSVLGIRAPEEM